ncbi:trypsin-like serine protease [Streptomyces scabiei]|uniref:trypsin-like serine protease n=1 Tax=Streptomyces scabiei TaxID=1930 RepID=UPI0029AB708B|nr:trypsin-like serine protease [Streptomyces scabiei]MDX3112107.1 trypsin-like serine protease [Streptomyces scabiei]
MSVLGRTLPTAAVVAALVGGMLATAPAHAVVGGGTATTPEWMVQIHATQPDGTVRICGGAAVGAHKVVTSAGCVTGAKSVLLAADTTSLLAETEMDPEGAETNASAVKRTWTASGYDAATGRDDIAVLTTRDPLHTARFVQPAASWDPSADIPGMVGAFEGWGSTSGDSKTPNSNLRKATLQIRPESECAEAAGAAWTPGRMFCTTPPPPDQETGGGTPCTGDEGGPLVVNGRLVGVYSRPTGSSCTAEGSRAVFTRVSALIGQMNPRIYDTDLSGDGLADLFAMTPAGQRYEYDSTGNGLKPRRQWPTLSEPYSRYRQVDVDRDGFQDYVYRTASGDLYQSYDVYAYEGWGNWIHDRYESKIGHGWNSMRSITMPGDVNGDDIPDIVAVDGDGVQWIYAFRPGTGGQGISGRWKSGTGWAGYTIFGSGDYTGDGKPDLLARDTAGRLWIYKGTGKGLTPWQTRAQVGSSGWNYTAYAASGDTDGDGKADFYARDSAGYLWLYKGTGNASAPFQNRVKIGGGWNIYSLIS